MSIKLSLVKLGTVTCIMKRQSWGNETKINEAAINISHQGVKLSLPELS